MWTLKDLPLVDEFTKKPKKRFRFPTKLNICENCLNVQLSVVPDVKGYYKNYIYPNTVNSEFQRHYQEYADYIKGFLKGRFCRRVLDFGKDDDYLLRCICSHRKQAIAIRPSLNRSNKNNLLYPKKYITSYDEKDLIRLSGKIKKKCDIIIVNNFLANIDDLKGVLKFFKTVASSKCLIFIETSNFNQMLQNRVFDMIYHEHLSYFHKYPLVKFFAKYGFECIEIKEVNTKGGSSRYVFKNITSHNCQRSQSRARNRGKVSIKYMFRKIGEIKKTLKTQESKIHGLLKKNKITKCAVYGASATTTAFLENMLSRETFTNQIDDNPLKERLYSPFSNLKVLTPSSQNLEKFDCIVIGAWRFADKIQNKLQSFRGLKINPWPKATIIK